jgi:membrane-associated phospholipid phosphatase
MNFLKNLIYKYRHGWILSYFFIYLIWFFALENRTVLNYNSIHIWLDDYIPFNEFFIIPYGLWFAYIAGVILFFFFHSKEDFYKICGFLFIGMTICLIIYTIWPNGQDLRPTTFLRDNFFVDIVKNLYLTDTSTNVFPSIHVFNSIGAHIAISHSNTLKDIKIVQYSSVLLMITICLSTVFLKQHSALDGFASIILSLVMYILVYKIDYVKLRNRSKEVSTTA